MLLFKFKNCGPLPSADGACQDAKYPLVHDQDDIQAIKTNTINGEQVLV